MKLTRDFLLNSIVNAKIYHQKGQFLTLNELSDDFFIKIKNQNFFISIDSRIIDSNDLFLARKGLETDGHNFIEKALKNGAMGAILDEKQSSILDQIPEELKKNKLFILVENTENALINLAKTWRSYFNIPIIAISGSIGKTTTKEMLKTILENADLKSLVSLGNQNMILSLSMNILKLSLEDEVGVFELGIHKPGDMSKLVSVLRPTIAALTYITYAHSKFLGNLSNIAYEKKQIFSLFNEKNIGVIPGDLAIISKNSYMHPVIRFGTRAKNHIHAKNIELVLKDFETDDINWSKPHIKFLLKIYNKTKSVRLQGLSPVFVHNALAACALAHLIGLPLEKIVLGLEKFVPYPGRFEIKRVISNGAMLINDCYNAGPDSMKSSILAFDKIPCLGKKIAVLGDMLELGEKEEMLHRRIGKVFEKTKEIKNIVWVGKHSKTIMKSLPVYVKINSCATWSEALDYLKNHLETCDCILLKASRGIGLTNIVENLT